MAETASYMIPLGTVAPDFKLLEPRSGNQLALQDIKSELATVIMFICNHCPYVKLIRDKLLEVTRAYHAQGIRFVAINSNNADAYPEDGPEKMKEEAER